MKTPSPSPVILGAKQTPIDYVLVAQSDAGIDEISRTGDFAAAQARKVVLETEQSRIARLHADMEISVAGILEPDLRNVARVRWLVLSGITDRAEQRAVLDFDPSRRFAIEPVAAGTSIGLFAKTFA